MVSVTLGFILYVFISQMNEYSLKPRVTDTPI